MSCLLFILVLDIYFVVAYTKCQNIFTNNLSVKYHYMTIFSKSVRCGPKERERQRKKKEEMKEEYGEKEELGQEQDEKRRERKK